MIGINPNGFKITDEFPIKDFQKALDRMNSKEAVKVVVKATQD